MVLSDKKQAKQSKAIAWVFVAIAAVVVIAVAINLNVDGELTQSSVASACQKEATIKMQGSDVDVVSMGNYNPQYSDTGTKASDGTHIKKLFWNGKLKNGSNSLQFVCSASGTKNHVHIESLQYGSKVLD